MRLGGCVLRLLLTRRHTHLAQFPERRVSFQSSKSPASGQTASLSSFAGRKAIFLDALIFIGSPVCGLRPERAAR